MPAGNATEETIAILDFGSQYSRLIARRVRECHVYCELVPYDAPPSNVAAMHPKGFILSGGPASVYEEGAPQLPPYVFESGLPVLGICYGMQLIARESGGKVVPAHQREYGLADVERLGEAPIFAGLPTKFTVWMSHGDRLAAVPPGFAILASSPNSPVSAIGSLDKSKGIYGLQFHPEVVHTPLGRQIIENFLYRVCGCRGTWTPSSFIDQSVAQIRERVGEGRVLCALSGGVDSSVAAVLLHRAIGDRLVCVFVNNGLLRANEVESVLASFQHLGIQIEYVDAADRFLSRLSGVVDPEEKRQVVGEEFIRVFEATAARMGPIEFLAQGTLYPDVIESAAAGDSAGAARIKTHHNVGGLPEDLRFQLVEPLRYLFKDEVREVGRELGLPDEIVSRQPFPGPGLAVRVIGEVTAARLATLRAADAIFRDEIQRMGLSQSLAQYFAVLPSVKSVGVMGDGRAYGDLIVLRAVTSEDYMTADWARLPYEALAHISNRIVNEVQGVTRVVYDITSKPPATIEWE